MAQTPALADIPLDRENLFLHTDLSEPLALLGVLDPRPVSTRPRQRTRGEVRLEVQAHPRPAAATVKMIVTVAHPTSQPGDYREPHVLGAVLGRGIPR